MKTLLLVTALSVVACAARGQDSPPVSETVKKAAPAAWLGVALDSSEGKLHVSGLAPGSPAEKAGIQAGDMILKVDEEAAGSDVKAFVDRIAKKQPGESIELVWSHEGSEKSAKIKLGERPTKPWPDFSSGEFRWAPPAPKRKDSPPARVVPASPGGGFLGVGLESGRHGVALSHVAPGSPAEKAGLRKGDEILSFDGMDVDRSEGVGKLRDLIAGKKPGDSVVLKFLRGDEKITARAELGARPMPQDAPELKLPEAKEPKVELDPWKEAKPQAKLLPEIPEHEKVPPFSKKFPPLQWREHRLEVPPATIPEAAKLRKVQPFRLEGLRGNSAARQLEESVWKRAEAAVSKAMKESGLAPDVQKQVIEAMKKARAGTSEKEARRRKLEAEASQLEKQVQELKARAEKLRRELDRETE